jgi:hypothetical protein
MIWGGLVMPDSTRNEDAAGPPAEADLAVELSDLRQAQAALPLPLAAPAERIGRWRPVSGWRLWRPLGVIGVVALALLAIGANLYGPAVARFFATKPVPPVTLGLRAGHIGCLVDAGWAPQGTCIALLGDGFLACGENTLPGRVAINDARAAPSSLPSMSTPTSSPPRYRPWRIRWCRPRSAWCPTELSRG